MAIPRPHFSQRTQLLSILLASSAAWSCSEKPRGPNVLFLSIDTLRADHLGCYGYERRTTPRIDAFAGDSVVFEQAHSSAPWTLPALASLQTGTFTSTHGCDRVESRLAEEFETMAETLRNAGWDTAIVACHVFLGGAHGLQQGFTHVDDDMITTAADLDQTISSPGMTDRGLSFLETKARAADGVPWMLWLHYFDPHADYLIHEGFSEAYGTGEDRDCYDGEIAFTDHHIGRIFEALEKLKLLENTVVVVVSDHGEEFGEHGDYRHGTNLYQEVIRVPLILRAPGLAPMRIAEPVGSVDVMPTVLELCGLNPPREIEGRSLLPLTRGETVDPRELLLEVRWRDGQDLRGMRRGQWKYCEYRQSGEGVDLLFDLTSDPLEKHDLSYTDRVDADTMRGHLEHGLTRALDLAGRYPTLTKHGLSPADFARLRSIGYVGEDGPTAEGGK